MVNRREFLLSGAATVASPFVCKAYGENLSELELIFALDKSGSVYTYDVHEEKTHWDIQIEGHMYALSHPRVREMLLDNKTFLRIVTWSDSSVTVETLFEQKLRSVTSCEKALDSLQSTLGQKCLGNQCASTQHFWLMGAINKMVPMGRRRVLDISTDEIPDSTSKTVLKEARGIFESSGGTVNALAVKMGTKDVATLRKELCSPQGFCIGAQKASDYSDALFEKVILEIA